MIGKGLTYADLARLLDEAGVHDNERNLRNKVSRGEFSATFMLMCLKVMGIKSIDLDDWKPDDSAPVLDGRVRTHFVTPGPDVVRAERIAAHKAARAERESSDKDS